MSSDSDGTSSPGAWRRARAASPKSQRASRTRKMVSARAISYWGSPVERIGARAVSASLQLARRSSARERARRSSGVAASGRRASTMAVSAAARSPIETAASAYKAQAGGRRAGEGSSLGQDVEGALGLAQPQPRFAQRAERFHAGRYFGRSSEQVDRFLRRAMAQGGQTGLGEELRVRRMALQTLGEQVQPDLDLAVGDHRPRQRTLHAQVIRREVEAFLPGPDRTRCGVRQTTTPLPGELESPDRPE